MERSAVYKSAFFMTKEEHTALVKELIAALGSEEAGVSGKKIMISGILADAPGLLKIFDDNDLQIVCDDVAAESRQYRTDAREEGDALQNLAEKFAAMDNCSVLYDVEKKRVQWIADTAAKEGAGVVIVLTKFCDPEEFDYPLIKKACDAKEVPVLLIEVDRQMENFEQARTMVETFKELL